MAQGPGSQGGDTSCARSREAGVSVVIPAYESWPILRRTLAAVLHDARALGTAWEVIVVDNESTPSLAGDVRSLATHNEPLHVIRRTGLRGMHYQPGSARNRGIQQARYGCLVFLDADCVPASGTIAHYRDRVARCRRSVFIGHRVFVDTSGLDADEVARERRAIAEAPPVRSLSNYDEVTDRRLAELKALDRHPRPYDCLFSCNFALHRECLGSLRFDPTYDGYWGYEDIDLGFRLHEAGRRFEYVPDAFVYHQEGGQVSLAQRTEGRWRNLRLLDARCPGFIDYRMAGARAGSSVAALGAIADADREEHVDPIPSTQPASGVNLLPAPAV